MTEQIVYLPAKIPRTFKNIHLRIFTPTGASNRLVELS